ncbi:50S ribosomal protein L11 methyltransferase [Neolewinella persica]|uniref:50S ribosomal protein L11 methyltransferase n=1 Tax=Neolewinella persica TaxID=70998 RepID=UPI00035EB4D1|nr:50S ribosomal protein L11 methyltransferase [Neolewinella persica]
MQNDPAGAEIQINKPTPIKSSTAFTSFVRGTDIQEMIDRLLQGGNVLIEEFYSNGLELLSELQTYLRRKHPGQGFQEQRAYRSEYRKLSSLVLIEIKDHQLAVKKAPSIGWLEKLYPESNDFLLTFPEVQGLNSAWQWYLNGVVVPVLRNKIHPYYGVYFPTRFEHLQLFDNWLKRYDGPKKSAIDVGIGSGILSLQLMKHGFQKSFGTDLNPNAIVGLQESMKGTKLAMKIELDYGHLFGKWIKPTELIVFNPPWLPASHDLGRLDEAIYYNEGLFPEFFQEAKKRLLPDGRVVLLFSNLGQITNVAKENPIEKELADGARFELDRFFKKSVKQASSKTRRNQHWRDTEEVELWVLKHKD